MTEPQHGLLHMARLFDSLTPDERPVVNRPAVPETDLDELLTYLKTAPIVLAARGFGKDAVEPHRPARVPMSFHTDGTWIWPGAVHYYLTHHGVPPEPDLVAHIRAHNFTVPEVNEQQRSDALSVITDPPPEIPEPVPDVREGRLEPLPGEPPITLFEGVQEQTLQPGTELDRYGDPVGNVVFDLGTPFRQRSLPPEWINRGYHVYQTARSVRVLTGAISPWFGQPGGGIAHILPAAIETLLADGTLTEIDWPRP